MPQQECLDGGAVNWPAAPGSACLSIVLEIMNKRETVVSLLVKPARRQAGRGSIQLDLNRLFNRIFNKVFIVVWGTLEY